MRRLTLLLLAALVNAAPLTARATPDDCERRAELEAPAPRPANHFGSALAATAARVLAGEPDADPDGPGSGAAHVLVRDAGAWRLEATLEPSDADAARFFGLAVALAADGATAAVGAPGDAALGRDAGAVHVFRRDGSTWLEEAVLRELPAGSRLGDAVALDGDVLLAGAPGSSLALVFERDATGEWSLQAVLEPLGRRSGDEAGAAVGLSGERAAVGAPGRGAVTLFEQSASSWVESDELVTPGEPGDRFGDALDLSGDLLLVGAWLSDEASDDAGAAHVFRHDAGWTEVRRLFATEPAPEDHLGRTVHLDGDGAAWVSAPAADAFGPDTGSVHPFARRLDDWWPRDPVGSAEPETNARFGAALASSGPALLIAAPFADAATLDDGRVEEIACDLENGLDCDAGPPATTSCAGHRLEARVAAPEGVEPSLLWTSDCPDGRFEPSDDVLQPVFRAEGCARRCELVLTASADGLEPCESRTSVHVVDDRPPLVVAALEPVEPGPPASACSPPSSVLVRVRAEAADGCDAAPAVSAWMSIETDDGLVLAPVSDGDRVEVQLVPPACPRAPRSARSAQSRRSDGALVVRGTAIALEVAAADRCGNAAGRIVDPAVGEPCGLVAPPAPPRSCR